MMIIPNEPTQLYASINVYNFWVIVIYLHSFCQSDCFQHIPSFHLVSKCLIHRVYQSTIFIKLRIEFLNYFFE